MVRVIGGIALFSALLGLWISVFCFIPFYGLWKWHETGHAIWAVLGIAEGVLAHCVWRGIFGDDDRCAQFGKDGAIF